MKEEATTRVREDGRLIAIILVVATLFVFGGGTLIYLNQKHSDWRTSVVLGKDLFIGFFTVCGILVAVESLLRSARSSRRLLALALADNWTAEWSSGTWRPLAAKLNQFFKPSPDEIYKNDRVAYDEIASLLNSCNRIAQAVIDGSADERTLRERLGEPMQAFYAAVNPMIMDMVLRTKTVGLYYKTQWLLDRWKAQKISS